jgi:uncharacterized LabA/DUF88 family protein
MEYVKVAYGCQVEVVSFGRSTSQKLFEATDDFIDLDEDKRKFLISPRRKRTAKK